MEDRAIPIGIENYKEIIEKEYYYIDKTLFLKEILDKKGKVNLFIRPRCFGKTLALSMVKTYFEQEIDNKGSIIDNSHYFQNMKIMEAGEKYTHHMGKYPVIVLSLKSAKQPDFEMAYASLLDEIMKEFDRHSYVLKGDILPEAKCEKYQKIMNGKAEAIDYAKALEFLSHCLKQYHGKRAIILIDEYDVPLEKYYHGFLCGLLKGCKGYRVTSNRESGTGRYDIVMRYPSARGQAMIMEIKVAATFDELEAGCNKALKQIEEQKYDTDLRKDGYRNITKYGICFYKKECMVKKQLY